MKVNGQVTLTAFNLVNFKASGSWLHPVRHFCCGFMAMTSLTLPLPHPQDLGHSGALIYPLTSNYNQPHNSLSATFCLSSSALESDTSANSFKNSRTLTIFHNLGAQRVKSLLIQDLKRESSLSLTQRQGIDYGVQF